MSSPGPRKRQNVTWPSPHSSRTSEVGVTMEMGWRQHPTTWPRKWNGSSVSRPATENLSAGWSNATSGGSSLSFFISSGVGTRSRTSPRKPLLRRSWRFEVTIFSRHSGLGWPELPSTTVTTTCDANGPRGCGTSGKWARKAENRWRLGPNAHRRKGARARMSGWREQISWISFWPAPPRTTALS